MIKIPNFTIEQEIGHGGMATVYLALQDILGLVALKVLLPDMIKDESLRLNFLNEGQALKHLKHPNIVRIHNVGIAEKHTFFMSMEYLSGGTLKDKIARGKLSLSEAIRILEEIANGLMYAHKKSYIHGDIKPSNILFRDTGEAVITDFNITTLQDASGLSRLSSTMATVQYTSPEQANTTHIDSRTDIYSLGLVFYEMLTGLEASKATHQQTAAPTDLPEEYAYLQDVMDKVLEKDPKLRYQTVLEFVQAVKQAPAFSKTSRKAKDTTYIDKEILYNITDSKEDSVNVADKIVAAQLKSEDAKKKKLLISSVISAVLVGFVIFGLSNFAGSDKASDQKSASELTQIELAKQEELKEKLKQELKEELKQELKQEQEAQALAEKNRIEKEIEEKRIENELIASQKLKEEQELENQKREAEEEAKRLAEEQKEEELAREKEAIAEAEKEQKEEEDLKKEEAEIEAEERRKIAENEELIASLPADALKAHNRLREKPLTWSNSLAQISQNLADKLADTCDIYSHPGLPLGESMFLKNQTTTIDEAVNTWASEEEFYDHEQNKCQEGKECGHYTQIVWEGTTEVGCGVQSCSNGSQIWVCEYGF